MIRLTSAIIAVAIRGGGGVVCSIAHYWAGRSITAYGVSDSLDLWFTAELEIHYTATFMLTTVLGNKAV
jgi:hypothetical protein